MPDIEPVQPGDLITAQVVNRLISEIASLNEQVEALTNRVGDLEDRVTELEQQGLVSSVESIDPEAAATLHKAGIKNLRMLSETEKEKVKSISGLDTSTIDAAMSEVDDVFVSRNP